jgi:hypothetical protein
MTTQSINGMINGGGKRSTSVEAYQCSFGNRNLHVHWSRVDSDYSIQLVCCGMRFVYETPGSIPFRFLILKLGRSSCSLTHTVLRTPRNKTAYNSTMKRVCWLCLASTYLLLQVTRYCASKFFCLLSLCLSMWVSDSSSLRYDNSLRLIFPSSHFKANMCSWCHTI